MMLREELADFEPPVLRDDSALRAVLKLLDVDLYANALAVKHFYERLSQDSRPPTFRRQMLELNKDAVIAELLAAERAERDDDGLPVLPPHGSEGYKTTSWRRHRDRQLARGLCGRCGRRPHRPGRLHCQDCTTKLAEQHQLRKTRRALAERLVAALRRRTCLR